MKIDFSYLMSGKFQLCENNILYTIENILSEKSKISIFGRFPNEDGEDFFFIDQVQVLNAVYDVEVEAKCQPRIRKWDRDDEEMGEKCLHVQSVAVIKDELVPGYGGFAISAEYRKYLSPALVLLYREIQIAKNNVLLNSVALLTGRFIDVFLAEEYGMDPAVTLDQKINGIKDEKLKKVIEYVHKTGNCFTNCVCGKKLKDITDEDVDKMMDFLHIFIENYISPKRAADLEKETSMMMKGAKAPGF